LPSSFPVQIIYRIVSYPAELEPRIRTITLSVCVCVYSAASIHTTPCVCVFGIEMSHRGSDFTRIMDAAETTLRQLL